MRYIIDPKGAIIVLIIALIFSVFVGSKRRIGFAWSFFFVFFWVLPGIIFILLSPSRKRLPPDDPRERRMNLIFGNLFLLLGTLCIASIFKSETEYFNLTLEELKVYKILFGIYFIGFGIYMVNRSKRHKELYEKFLKSDFNEKAFDPTNYTPPDLEPIDE